LQAGGMDPDTPACIVENGTLPDQRQRIATIATLEAMGFTGPALIVVGEVVRLAHGGRARVGQNQYDRTDVAEVVR
jgi:siroheme synthase